MNRLLISLSVIFVVGCGNLQADYIQQDRAHWIAITPCIEAGISAVGSRSLEGRAWRLLHDSKDGNIKAAEEKVAQQ